MGTKCVKRTYRIFWGLLHAPCWLLLVLTDLVAAQTGMRPMDGLSREQTLVFLLGGAQFAADWVPAPSAMVAFDGLGPLYGATSCAACHPDGGGSRAVGSSAALADRSARLTAIFEPPDETYGDQIQAFSSFGGGEPFPAIEWRTVDPVVVAGRSVTLRSPVYSLAAGGVAPGGDPMALSGRVPPQVTGAGLLAAIPEQVLLSMADPQDVDGDGISGRANLVTVDDRRAVGRFGWRAEQPTVAGQVMHAFSRDMGLSSPGFPEPWGDCTHNQNVCREAPTGAGGDSGPYEVPSSVVDQLAAAVGWSSPPRAAPPPQSAGSRLFDTVKCAACHSPRLPVAGFLPPLNHAHAYTDLLLHDLGDGLSAGGGDFGGAREWRTAPLWGIHDRLASGDASFLHDGRARSVAEAILWHAGEAAGSREAFLMLSVQDQMALIEFVELL